LWKLHIKESIYYNNLGIVFIISLRWDVKTLFIEVSVSNHESARSCIYMLSVRNHVHIERYSLFQDESET
jgi:hypothetical protein